MNNENTNDTQCAGCKTGRLCDIQTRSEETGISYFSPLSEALSHANKDESVWKISFSLPSGERIRLLAEPVEENRVNWVLDYWVVDLTE